MRGLLSAATTLSERLSGAEPLPHPALSPTRRSAGRRVQGRVPDYPRPRPSRPRPAHGPEPTRVCPYWPGSRPRGGSAKAPSGVSASTTSLSLMAVDIIMWAPMAAGQGAFQAFQRAAFGGDGQGAQGRGSAPRPDAATWSGSRPARRPGPARGGAAMARSGPPSPCNPDPLQTGQGQDHGVRRAVGQLGEAGIDITAHKDRFEIGTQVQGLKPVGEDLAVPSLCRAARRAMSSVSIGLRKASSRCLLARGWRR